MPVFWCVGWFVGGLLVCHNSYNYLCHSYFSGLAAHSEDRSLVGVQSTAAQDHGGSTCNGGVPLTNALTAGCKTQNCDKE